MLAAVGFASLFYKSGRYAKVCLVGIFAIMIVLSISNDFVASDNPLVKRPFFTYYLTQGRVNGIDDLANMTCHLGFLMSDYVVKRYMDFSSYASVGQLIEISNDVVLKNSPDDIMMVRDSELTKTAAIGISAEPWQIFAESELR